jgi:2-polyprenyl-6-methoxyphenol hydroxylase-like FAD-dependent oxidoreductase
LSFLDLETDVAIVGAGVAGSALACALSRGGVHVALLERRGRTGGIHRGDSLLPKATRMLARWGVLDAVRAAGAEPIDRLEIHHARHGQVAEIPLTGPADDTPYLVLPHASFEEVLITAAAGAEGTRLVRPAKVTAVEARGGGALVRYETAGMTGTVRARVVVGADGHASLVRRAARIAMAVREYDHAYLGLEADRPPTYQNAMRVHFHADGGVLLMPRPTRVGLGVLVDAGSAMDWLTMSDARLRQRLVARAPILAGMRLHRAGTQVYALTRGHADRYVAGPFAIIGDAAHVTNPTAGQGMAMALADAGLLADLLGPALTAGVKDLGPTLAAYEARQWPINRGLVRTSHLLALAYALRGEAWDRLKIGVVRALGRVGGTWVARPVIRNFLRPHDARAPEAVA